MDNQKQCGECKEYKELTDFYTYEKVTKQGMPYISVGRLCKKCTCERNNKRNKENPEPRKKSYTNWNDRNKEKIKISSDKRRREGKILEWQRNNPDKLRMYGEHRRNKIHKISKVEWKACKDYFNNSCAYCGLKQGNHFIYRKGELINIDLHKEHVMHDGDDTLENCVPACQSCNSSKRTYVLEEWYNEDNPNFTIDNYYKIINWMEDDYKLYKE